MRAFPKMIKQRRTLPGGGGHMLLIPAFGRQGLADL